MRSSLARRLIPGLQQRHRKPTTILGGTMRPAGIIGVLLIVFGAIVLVLRGVSYVKDRDKGDLGIATIQTERRGGPRRRRAALRRPSLRHPAGVAQVLGLGRAEAPPIYDEHERNDVVSSDVARYRHRGAGRHPARRLLRRWSLLDRGRYGRRQDHPLPAVPARGGAADRERGGGG